MPEKHAYTILVADDNHLNLRVIEKTLSKEGYKIFCADNGPDARTIAFRKKPDLILLDVEMPGENGFAVIKKLKNNSQTSEIPVLFLSGILEVNSKLKGFALGAVDYITKPFHPLEILARVRIHLKLSIATNSLVAEQAGKLRQISRAQAGMMPVPGENPHARFSVYYQSLEEAGGDFYDILNISDHIIGYFVADFSGHDIQTSYMTASVKALLAQNCSPVYSPAESMKMINDVLVEILPEGKYLTACYLHLNRTTKKLTIINAGHPPVIFIPRGGKPGLIKTEGDVLGIFKDAHFGSRVVDVSGGDRFFAYSDGLVESARDRITWVNGADGLLEAYRHIANVAYDKAPMALVNYLYGPKFLPEDDIVVLCVEV
jgi:sigma-B regulation protein RsbU (phosphoserine phosphatase)